MKATCFLLATVCLMACNNEGEKSPGAAKQSTKKTSQATDDSYTSDTLYQALPQLLEDLSASEDMENLLAQNWVNADDKEALEYAGGSSVEFPVRSFSMGADKSLVKNVRNFMETGTWQFDAAKKTIRFTYAGGGTDTYKIRALAADELQLVNIGIHSETPLVFVSDAKRHRSAETEPFTLPHLKWRIAPRAAETEDAIKQRVKDFLQFYILYYKDAVARRAAIVSFYGFPTCLKWYAGGIYLEKDKDILKNWEGCFYNKAQSEKGLEVISGLLDKKYIWPSGNENWIKKNLFVLEQMYANL